MSMRDAGAPLGYTLKSAGSHTEAGGYTGAGADDLHLTVRGRRQDLAANGNGHADAPRATGQFEIADGRSPATVAAALRARGLEPVWKDWDHGL